MYIFYLLGIKRKFKEYYFLYVLFMKNVKLFFGKKKICYRKLVSLFKGGDLRCFFVVGYLIEILGIVIFG